MAKYVFFLHDPEYDTSYRGSNAISLDVLGGKVGYAEFAGKVMQKATAIIHDDGVIIWQNGTLWRFDENGFVDQEYVKPTMDAQVEQALWGDPKVPDQSAEWRMRMRRANANRDMMILPENIALRMRLEDYLNNGTKHPQIKTTRGLTKVLLEDDT